MRVYVASSWKNPHLDAVHKALRKAKHETYDFRANEGFHWSDVEPDYLNMQLKPNEFQNMLLHEKSEAGFDRDMDHLDWANAVVGVLPCGRSAHLELGWASGVDLLTGIVLLEEPVVPELMYLMLDFVAADIDEMLESLEVSGALTDTGRKK